MCCKIKFLNKTNWIPKKNCIFIVLRLQESLNTDWFFYKNPSFLPENRNIFELQWELGKTPNAEYATHSIYSDCKGYIPNFQVISCCRYFKNSFWYFAFHMHKFQPYIDSILSRCSKTFLD